jgi:hypothetical protein
MIEMLQYYVYLYDFYPPGGELAEKIYEANL